CASRERTPSLSLGFSWLPRISTRSLALRSVSAAPRMLGRSRSVTLVFEIRAYFGPAAGGAFVLVVGVLGAFVFGAGASARFGAGAGAGATMTGEGVGAGVVRSSI